MRTELRLRDVRGRLHEHGSQQAFPDGRVVGNDQCLDTARACAVHFYVFRATGNSKSEASSIIDPPRRCPRPHRAEIDVIRLARVRYSSQTSTCRQPTNWPRLL